VLHERGCLVAAKEQIRRAEGMEDAEALKDLLVRTRTAIESDTRQDSAQCSALVGNH